MAPGCMKVEDLTIDGQQIVVGHLAGGPYQVLRHLVGAETHARSAAISHTRIVLPGLAA